MAAGIILSGGENKRMEGLNKAFLSIGGRSLLLRNISELRRVCREVVVVTNEPGDYKGLPLKIKITRDLFPGKGPLGGIHAGLAASSYYLNFVVACDMPFVEAPLVSHMLKLAEGYDAVVPCVDACLQPLCAVYTKSCLPYIERSLQKENCRIVDFYPRARVRFLDEKEINGLADVGRVFLNVNTPEDWLKVQKLFNKQPDREIK